MKFTQWCVGLAFFFMFAFLAFLFILPTREWFPDLNTYCMFTLSPLVLMVLCLMLSFWPAFHGQKKRYFAFIIITIGVAVMVTAVFTSLEAKIGMVRMWIGSVIIIGIGGIYVMIEQVFKKTPRH